MTNVTRHFFLFEAATQLARQVHQERTKVVCSNKVDRSLVIQTGKLQPGFIWREKPVLLALLSNLTIPVPA